MDIVNKTSFVFFGACITYKILHLSIQDFTMDIKLTKNIILIPTSIYITYLIYKNN
jgi:hypothetical protein